MYWKVECVAPTAELAWPELCGREGSGQSKPEGEQTDIAVGLIAFSTLFVLSTLNSGLSTELSPQFISRKITVIRNAPTTMLKVFVVSVTSIACAIA